MTPRRLSLLRVVVLSAMLCAGCTLIVDTDGFTSDGVPSALAPAEGGGPRDSGATDAVVDVDASRPLCDSASYAFCDDFNVAALKDQWSNVRDNGATLDVVREGSDSFLRASIPAAAGVRKAKLHYGSKIVPTKKVTFEHRARIPKLPSGGGAQTAALSIGRFPENVILVLDATSTGVRLFEQNFMNSGFESDPVPSFALGAWHRVSLTVRFDVNPVRFSLSVDDVTVLDKATSTGITPRTVELNVGVNYAGPAPAFSIDTDNVTLLIE